MRDPAHEASFVRNGSDQLRIHSGKNLNQLSLARGDIRDQAQYGDFTAGLPISSRLDRGLSGIEEPESLVLRRSETSSKGSELARTAMVLRDTGGPPQPGLSAAFLRHSTYSKGVIHRIVTTWHPAMLLEEREGRHRAKGTHLIQDNPRTSNRP